MDTAVLDNAMEDHYFLGSSNLMAENNRIAIPQIVERFGIVETNTEVFWAYDREEEAIAASQNRDIFKGEERYDFLDGYTLGSSRVSIYPLEILEEYRYWEMGDQVFFVATEVEVQNNVVRIIPRDQLEDRFSSLLNEE